MKKVFVLLLLTGMLGLSLSANAQKISRQEPVSDGKSEGKVMLANLVAVTDGNGVYLRWSSVDERNILGYYIYRASKVGSGDLPAGFVPGGYLRSKSTDGYYGEYSFFDVAGEEQSEYVIEAVRATGKRSVIGPVGVDEVTDVAMVAGRSSSELAASSMKPTSVEYTQPRLPGELQKSLPEFAGVPDPVTQQWIAAQPGVKILVKQRGLYRVLRTQLQSAGFDLSGPSSKWQLFVEGREIAISVAPDETYFEFYGEGMNTLESDLQAYYLVNGTNDGRRMGSRVIRPIAAPVPSSGYIQTFKKIERGSYLSGILNGPAENFFGSFPIGNASSLNYTINLAAIDYSVARSTVRISLQGLTVNPHDVEVAINGVLQPTTINFNGQSASVGNFEIDTSLLIEGNNTISMRGLAGTNDFTVIESVSVDYSRKFSADQNQLGFYTTNYKSTKLTGFASANVRVFDLSVPESPDVVPGLVAVANGPTFDLTIPSNRGRVLYAVEDSAIKAPAAIVRNYPSTYGTPTNQASMIIVTHRDFMTEAQTWANYRTAQGTSTIVIDVADIFDEYSYGTQSAAAMTTFFEYAKNNWQTAPNYIMILGDATYDPRNYGNAAFNSYVPTELIDTLYEETGSDEALCDFNDDGLSELAVGRVPARSGAEATTMLTKTTQFESNLTNPLARGALFVSDQPIGYDFEGVNNRVSQQLPNDTPKVFVSRVNADARTQLLTELNAGHYLVNYSGHGSTLFWAASSFYHRNDLASMTNSTNLSIFTLLTCLNGYYLSPAFDSFAEAAIKTPSGGASIVWASSGKTTPDVQEVMATRFYNQIGIGNITRAGDLVRDAKQSLIGGRDVRLSWTLFGDPAMKVR